MIIVVPYPNKIELQHQMRIPKEVFYFIDALKKWCDTNMQGPYTIDFPVDMMAKGVRVRVGLQSDAAHLILRWGVVNEHAS